MQHRVGLNVESSVRLARRPWYNRRNNRPAAREDLMFDGWESIIVLVVAILGVYGVILWLGLDVWAYRDIRERTRDSWSQTVAVLLVAIFNVPGLLLYLLLRPHETLTEAYERRLENEMLRQEMTEQRRSCPTCQRPGREDFLLCPHCRTSPRAPCGLCSRPLE